MTETKNQYLHPQWQAGIKSHVPHHESVNRIEGHLTGRDEYGLSVRDLDQLHFESSRELLPLEKELLEALETPVYQGLPLKYSDPEEYLKNAIFITPSHRGVHREHAISLPDAGRAVSRREGYVLSNKQLLLYHDFKGVGMTKSVDKVHSDRTYGPFGSVGISQDIATDMSGTAHARRAGILSPFIFPPITLDEVMPHGKRILAKDYSNDPIYAIQRGWACNYRVSSLFRGAEGSFTDDDFPLLRENPYLSVMVARSRIARFISDCRILNGFNRDHGSQYFLGCSGYFNGEFDYEDYVQAFRKQLMANTVASILGEVNHNNLSAQNVSLAGEWGDWDNYFCLKDGVVVNYPVSHSKHDDPSYLHTRNYETLFRSYQYGSLVQVLLSRRQPLNFYDWWIYLQKSLPSSHLYTRLNLDEFTMLRCKFVENSFQMYHYLNLAYSRYDSEFEELHRYTLPFK